MTSTLKRTQPIRFSPQSLCDTLDATDEPDGLITGAMAFLQNLIPDPTTKNLWTCRPASILLVNFAGGDFNADFNNDFNNQIVPPYPVSVFITVGPWIYGMIAHGDGFDHPFAYNIKTQSFTTITLVISPYNTGDYPATQSTTGDWVPPTMAVVGTNIIVTHPGFNGLTDFYGVINITNEAAPTWFAGQMIPLGAIVTESITFAGSGGTPGTYTNVPALYVTPPGTGSGALFDVTVSGGGAVTGLIVTAPGLGYEHNDLLTFNSGEIGGVTGMSFNVGAVTNSAIVFSTRPDWVAQFNERAWFGVNPTTSQPSVIFTDPLVLQVTNANQALTFGDDTPLTAAAGLPLNTQLGGIIGSLMVFKGASNIEQITGDPTTNNLAVNSLNVATGTLSPRSICPSPLGLFFMAPDGVRYISFTAQVSPPIGVQGTGVALPFINATYPSRLAAGCNATVLRISVQNGNLGGSPWQEYWYDLTRQVWSGPHTFPSTCYGVYMGETVICPYGPYQGNLALSNVFPNLNSQWFEVGNRMTFVFQTSVLADSLTMSMSEIAQMQVKTTNVSTVTSIVINAIDAQGDLLNTFTYNYLFHPSSAVYALRPRRVDFPSPTVYNRLAIQVLGNCGLGLSIGDIFIRRRELAYMQEVA